MSENQHIAYEQSWHDDYLKWVFHSWGRGTLKIINWCKEYGLPEPLISEKNGGIEVLVLASNEVNEGLVKDWAN